MIGMAGNWSYIGAKCMRALLAVVGFIFSDAGLLYNPSLEGSNIIRIAR